MNVLRTAVLVFFVELHVTACSLKASSFIRCLLFGSLIRAPGASLMCVCVACAVISNSQLCTMSKIIHLKLSLC